MIRHWRSHSLSWLLVAVLALILLAPIFTVVRQGLVEQDGTFSLFWIQEVFRDPILVEGLINSILVAITTTALTLIIALPLALLAESYDFRGKAIWLALIQVPLVLPPFVGALGLKGLLSRNGGINELLERWGVIEPGSGIDWLGITVDLNPLLRAVGLLATGDEIDWLALPQGFLAVVVLMALYLYPITFLNVQAALANIDPAMSEAARNLGAGGWRRFWRITLPLMRPGVFAGSTIVFIWAFTELGTPLMVGWHRLTAVQVFFEIQSYNPGRLAYALVIVLLGASVLLYAIGKLILGRGGGAMLSKATVAAQRKKLGAAGTLLITLPFAVVFFAAVLPHIGVVLNSVSGTGRLPLSFDEMTLSHHQEILAGITAASAEEARSDASFNAAQSIINSFKYAGLATVVTITLGLAIAYLIVRRPSPLNAVLDHLAMLPLAVPGLVMAFGYFAMTQPGSLFGNLFESLDPLENDPTPLLVIAYATRRLPFMVRACVAGLEQTSVSLEESAANLGSGTFRTLLLVTIPLLLANIIAGSLLVFSRAMLEVSDSLILVFDEPDYPMTKAIWSISQLPRSGLELASALGVWGMVILIITIAGASLALGKRLGALFRV